MDHAINLYDRCVFNPLTDKRSYRRAFQFKLLNQNLRQLLATDAAAIVADAHQGIVQTLLLLLGNGLLALLLDVDATLLQLLAALLVGIHDAALVAEHDAPVRHLLMARIGTHDGDDAALLPALQHRASLLRQHRTEVAAHVVVLVGLVRVEHADHRQTVLLAQAEQLVDQLLRHRLVVERGHGICQVKKRRFVSDNRYK